MAKHKPVPAGRLLKDEHGLQIYALSAYPGYCLGDFEIVTAAFDGTNVALRVLQAAESSDERRSEVSQVVLSQKDFETLIASYRAYQRAEKKYLSHAAPAHDDFDPFLDDPDFP